DAFLEASLSSDLWPRTGRCWTCGRALTRPLWRTDLVWTTEIASAGAGRGSAVAATTVTAAGASSAVGCAVERDPVLVQHVELQFTTKPAHRADERHTVASHGGRLIGA